MLAVIVALREGTSSLALLPSPRCCTLDFIAWPTDADLRWTGLCSPLLADLVGAGLAIGGDESGSGGSALGDVVFVARGSCASPRDGRGACIASTGAAAPIGGVSPALEAGEAFTTTRLDCICGHTGVPIDATDARLSAAAMLLDPCGCG